MAEITVIIPIYNTEKYLSRCIDSLLCQTFDDFDCILINDGSTDRSGQLCDDYKKRYYNVNVIHQPNRGRAVARNVGVEWALEQSESKWITFVDSDDWVHRDYLKKLYHAVISDNTDISMCSMQLVEDFVEDIKTQIIPRKQRVTEAYFDKNGYMKAYVCANLYRKVLFEDVRFPDGRVWEDMATAYKLLFKCEYVSVINENLYYYFKNIDGIVRSKWTLQKLDELIAYEEILNYFEERNPDIYSKVLILYADRVRAQLGDAKASEDLNGAVKDKTVNILNNKLKKSIWKCQKMDSSYFSRYYYNFERAYPKSMYMYWVVKGVINKLMSIVRG